MNTSNIILVIVLISVLILDIRYSDAAGKKDAEERKTLELDRLEKLSLHLSIFKKRFKNISNQTQTANTFGPLAAEYIILRNHKNGGTSDHFVDQELKHLYSYFFASTVKITPADVFVNSYVTHFATWMKFNFQVCVSYYKIEKKNQNIAAGCKQLSEYLDLFISTLDDLRSQQFTKFKNNLVKDLKKNQAAEKENKIELELEAFQSTKVSEPGFEKCNEATEAHKKTYCEIWINLLKDQPNDFKLNHVFFNAYLLLKIPAKQKYDFDPLDFLYAFDINENLWKKASQLLELTKNTYKSKIESNIIKILDQIMELKKQYINEYVPK